MMRRLMWLSQLFYFLLLLFSQYISSSSTSSSSFSSALLCSQHQSSALLQFKQLFSFSKEASSVCEEAGYRSYPKMKSWKEDTDCCSWDGVRCDSTKGDVIGLDLSCSWLYGTVPSKSSLFLLPHLQQLNLACNYFNHSPISSGFGQFVRLKYLNLSYSMFSGQVPSELPNLSELASLDLSGYGNVSLETSVVKRLVQNLTKLRELHLDHVNMSSVSLSSLMNLSSTLTSLTLDSCFLRGRLLDHIFRLPNLQELSLAHNPELTWFFPTVNSSNALRVLDVSYTNYSGELPKSIGKLTFLSHLIMSGCNFSEPIPTWLGNLTQLTILNLSANNFGGQMPSSLSNLKELSSLDLRANNLNGTLPMWLGNLTRLTKILLGTNSFTGQLPSSLSNIKDLTFVGLRYNNFEGRIPDFLTNLTKLTSVFLSFNQLTSQFGEFQFSNSLEVLALDNNRLNGSIPKSISNLTNLNNLDLSANDLTSIVDLDMFKNLKKLKTVYFSHNLLHGKLPVVPSSVNSFLMERNRFSGEIPYTACNATFLTILDISRNNLRGTIPSCLGNISNFLSVMNLQGNHFHGTIPDTFAKGNRLRTLALADNYLEGLLPKSLVNCINLELLNLGKNMINDSFPYWLEALPKLQVLILRSNKFYGPIRNHKTGGMFFPKLRIFDLSHNDFIGSLPTQFFEQFKAIMTTNESEDGPKYIGEEYSNFGFSGTNLTENYILQVYRDSIIITMKGNEFALSSILTIFTIIDLSSNMFYGKIPETLGTLKFLRVLNLSHNSLTSHIPSSLANLTALESLDLSSNMLTGEIPMQLTSLTFLAVLNLSQNLLTGPIPQEKQFGTFQNTSYDGNPGLCGFPLSMKCSSDESPPPRPSIVQEDNGSMFARGFGWKAVLIGYGCGLVFGLAVGYVAFKTEKPHWLVRFVEGERNGKTRRPNNKRLGRRRT